MTLDLTGRTVVVTGAGRGIGAAYAKAFVAQGANVVVNDLDPVTAEATAADLGAVALPGDASSESGVQALVDAVRERFERIDVYCANAGVARGGTEAVDEKAWEVSWNVNVMAHVRAAKLLVPEWLERGSGTFVSTASAAGLLSIPGAAPYAVTKHAAVAFAEWLSMTYGDKGISVHAVCPQGVRTDMLWSSGAAGRALMEPSAVDPDDVARDLLAAMEAGRFLVLPHPEVGPMYAARAADPDRWLAGMRRMAAGLPAVTLGTD
ncbi:SDR family oxidoreductase [Nostocoides sp. HKS02]|uniref:SDR family NAD(P)-dependent oxidoreductase n=1 Tax=Nostocoides sp. HKS02 TaxID=1813880 RepID=UPI0012B4EFF6|nr:SDR family oxidoreductase [Tetrasphaera sp. HKS02]QGN56865.1 SDR family NAD(P)-dependent oxidoreductase [Tetrasphaera sp. HKS02]